MAEFETAGSGSGGTAMGAMTTGAIQPVFEGRLFSKLAFSVSWYDFTVAMLFLSINTVQRVVSTQVIHERWGRG